MRRDRTAVGWLTCTENKYQQAGNKIIISSADVDGGAPRAINLPLVNFLMVFLINLFMPADHKKQRFSKVFAKFWVLKFLKAETLGKGVFCTNS